MVEHAGSSSAQRVRVGLTGLAFAFVFVLLGSAISRSVDDAGSRSAPQNTTASPSEPLAELGVAPGAGEAEANGANAANK